MSITAIIPTRAGSERLKNKNTRKFANSNLLQIKIDILKKLKDEGLINNILINTNCNYSKAISKKNNIQIIKRDEYFASSECAITDYWKEVITNGVETSTSMLCQVTSPLISLKSYINCIEYYNIHNKPIMTVNYIKDYIWKISGSKQIAINYDYPNHPRSQDLPKNYFQINFGIVIIKIEDYLKYNNLVSPNTKFIPLDRNESIDIDDAVDFKIAENIFKNKVM